MDTVITAPPDFSRTFTDFEHHRPLPETQQGTRDSRPASLGLHRHQKSLCHRGCIKADAPKATNPTGKIAIASPLGACQVWRAASPDMRAAQRVWSVINTAPLCLLFLRKRTFVRTIATSADFRGGSGSLARSVEIFARYGFGHVVRSNAPNRQVARRVHEVWQPLYCLGASRTTSIHTQ